MTVFEAFSLTSLEVKASGGCHGIGKEFLGDVSLKSSQSCDNG